jgi:hypothetical protein
MGAKRTQASRDMYLHQAKMPHSPVRSEASIGLVIERKELENLRTACSGIVIIATINYMRCILN